MKKIILMILVVVCTTNYCIAQGKIVDNRDKLKFGFKAGLNYSNVYDSKGEQFDASGKFGFATGAFVSIPISKFLGVQPEILFSQKGFQATGAFLGSTYKLTRTTDFIDVPLLLSIKPVEPITIFIGPQYSFLLKQRDVFKNSALTVVQEQEFTNDNIRKNILCLTGGFDINLKRIVLSARGGWDIQNNNGDGTSTTPRYKNAWYQATIGYRIL